MVSAQVCWGGKDLAATVASTPGRTVGRKWLTLLMNPGGKTGGRHVADRERADSTAARCTEPHQLATVVGARVNRDGREVEGFRNAGRVSPETRSSLGQHGGRQASWPEPFSRATNRRSRPIGGATRKSGTGLWRRALDGPQAGPSGGSSEARQSV